MEDVLYILIGVAWVAYSIYSYNQKAKRQQEARKKISQGNQNDNSNYEEQIEPPKRAFDDIFSKIQSFSEKEFDSSPYYSPEEETVFAEPEIESIENISSVEEVTESNSPLSKEMFQGYLEKDKNKIERKEVAQKEYDATNNQIEENEEFFEFELKKAIIYSEILKRPEY